MGPETSAHLTETPGATDTSAGSSDDDVAREWEAALAKEASRKETPGKGPLEEGSGLGEGLLGATARPNGLCRVVFESSYDRTLRRLGKLSSPGAVWYPSRAAALGAARFFLTLGQTVRIQHFDGKLERVDPL